MDDVVFLTISWLSSYILGPVIDSRSLFKFLPQGTQSTFTKEQLANILKEFRSQQLPPVEVNADHAVKALERLGVAFEVYDHPGVYCIPAHLPEGDRQEIWQAQADTRMQTYVGRRVECMRSTDIFTPGLFSFFQSTTAVCLDVHAQLHKGWMKMVKIHYGTVPTECLVELSNHERCIDVVVRGPTGSERRCVSFLTTVMSSLNRLLTEKSPGTQLEMYCLSLTQMKEARKYPAGFKIEDVEKAKVNGPYGQVVSRTEGNIVTENVGDLMVFISDQAHYSKPLSVEEAVLIHGQSQWYEFGVALGLRNSEIAAICHDKSLPTGKLLAITQTNTTMLGKAQAEEALLGACKSIPVPVYDAVLGELRASGSSFA